MPRRLPICSSVCGSAAPQPVAKLEHPPVPDRQSLERSLERLVAQAPLRLLLGKRAVAGHEVAEDGVLVLADRLVEARRGSSRGPHLGGLLKREPRLLGDLLERRLAGELHPEAPLGLVHLLHALDDVDRHADRPRLVGDRALHGLADPPRRIGRELEPALPLELLDRADEPEHALLDEIEERKPLVAVVLGDRHDQPQVRLDHPLLRGHVALLDPLGELDLVRSREQRVASDLPQEELQRVGRGLDGRLERILRRLRGGRLGDRLRRRAAIDDLDSALFQLPQEPFEVLRLELELLHGLHQLCVLEDSARLGGLDELRELFGVRELYGRVFSHGGLVPSFLPNDAVPAPRFGHRSPRGARSQSQHSP